MDVMDGSRRLIGSALTGAMEDDCGPNAAAQLLRQEHRRLRRLSLFLAVVHVLLISVVLAFATVLGAGARSPDCKSTMQPSPHPPAVDTEKHPHRANLDTPSAMGTGMTSFIYHNDRHVRNDRR